MFGATGSAAPVTRSVDVGTAEAVATSAASPAPRCADGPSPGRSMRGATAAAAPGLALAAATEPGRMDWAALLQRVYLYDVLACPCGGARTILADVSDPDLVRHILHDLGLPADPPHVARARDPTYDDDA